MAIRIAIPIFDFTKNKERIMDNKITIRSDRKDDYVFQYKGEDVTLKAGSILSIADGLSEVVLPTCVMKIVKNLIVIKDDAK
ncbi:MAG: hypothetical protein MJ237_06475 [bacterium]|nr:hypothetical protein [bacterium]